MSHVYDLIIVGGGLIGLSTAYNAVNPLGGHPVLQGERVLVLEQFSFFNQLGSAAGASRQFRIQYTEDFMSQLVLDAIPEWQKLQLRTTAELIPQVGSLWFGEPDASTTEGSIASAIETMEKLGIPYQPLTAREVEDWYGFRHLPKHYKGFFQPQGGIINVPATLQAMFNAAHNQGVHLKEHQEVTGISSDGKEVAVVTQHGTYRGKKLVLTAGAYINELLRPLGIQFNLTIWNMVSAYFRKTAPDVKYPTWFVFQKPDKANANLYYGFPEAAWSHPGFIRVAPDYEYQTLKSVAERRPPTPKDFTGTSRWVARHMSGLAPEPHFTSSCVVAMAADDQDLVLDFLPGHKNIVVYSTGWAAKLVPLLGKICVQLATTGKTPYDISPFRITPKTLSKGTVPGQASGEPPGQGTAPSQAPGKRRPRLSR